MSSPSRPLRDQAAAVDARPLPSRRVQRCPCPLGLPVLYAAASRSRSVPSSPEAPLPHKPGLSGTLATMAFPDLLQWISQARKAGTLSVQHEALVKRLFLREGVITSSGGNDPREFLGQIMIAQQLVT